jgi:hypothetical protein
MNQQNPLAAKPQTPKSEHPMMNHARVWRHVQQMHPDDIAAKTDRLDYMLPILGELARNPKVTSKDVIKAAAQAAADGKAEPNEAVQFISQMPDDPAKLQPWLRNLYETNISAQIHMKAARIQQAQAAQQPTQAAPVTPTSMTPGEAT